MKLTLLSDSSSKRSTEWTLEAFPYFAVGSTNILVRIAVSDGIVYIPQRLLLRILIVIQSQFFRPYHDLEENSITCGHNLRVTLKKDS